MHKGQWICGDGLYGVFPALCYASWILGCLHVAWESWHLYVGTNSGEHQAIWKRGAGLKH